MFLVKKFLILALVATGIWFLLAGFEIEIALVKFKGFEAHNVHIGVFFLIIAAVMAINWKVTETTTTEETTTSEVTHDPITREIRVRKLHKKISRKQECGYAPEKRTIDDEESNGITIPRPKI